VFGDNVPVLLFAGGPIGRRYTPPHFDPVENYRHVTKWAADINPPARTVEIMRRAFHNLRNGNPGPVLIETSNELLDAEIGDFDYTPVQRVRSAPDPADVRRAAELMLKAACPVIYAGQGIMYAGATDALVRLAELIQAPVLTTNTGKGAFPEDHPLSLGAAVNSAPKTMFHFLKKADPLIGLGTSLTRNNWGPKVPPGKRVIHATNSADDINKEFPTEAAILGDAKLVIEALIAEIGNRRRDDGGRMAAEVAAVREDWKKEWAPELASSEVPINQYRIINDLQNAVDRDNTIVTHDAGSPREHMVTFWRTRFPRGYLGWGKTTQLGHGLGVIMGAKLVHPDKLCINVMGDASIGMVGMDIETAVRNRLGILTIVFNNGLMAGERATMPLSIEKHQSLSVGGNYAGVARELGAWSARLTKPDEFLPTLERAIAATKEGQPALIECIAKENTKFSRY
jgi:acetolactate synthase I/II/III large subunit